MLTVSHYSNSLYLLIQYQIIALIYWPNSNFFLFAAALNTNDEMLSNVLILDWLVFVAVFVERDVVIPTLGGMAGPLKATTGLAGLAVAHYPHRMLTSVYQKILKTIKDMPEDYAYRRNTQVSHIPSLLIAYVNTYPVRPCSALKL